MLFQGFSISGASLKLLGLGETGIVARLKQIDDYTAQKLREMEILPGTSLTLEQRSPRFVVRTSTQSHALNDRMIQAIYVRIDS